MTLHHQRRKAALFTGLCLAALVLGSTQSATAAIPAAGAAGAVAGGHHARGATDPFDPASHHPYRHGVLPTRSRHARMRAWERAQGTGGDPVVPQTLSYGGGVHGVGVLDGHAKVYLVFYGSQWGAERADRKGDATFSHDPDGAAPAAQEMFKGVGTHGERWSADLTQWCDGPAVAPGATRCPVGARFIPYQSGGVLAGVWYDNSVRSPGSASGHQLAQVAVAAARHFRNTTPTANREAYYVILSPHGTNPDLYQGQYCAWHDSTMDPTLTGGAAASPYGDLAFSNQPYNPDSGSSCGVGFVNSPGLLDGWTITLGHEWHEAMSDPIPAGGWTNNTTSSYNGDENADECAWLTPGTPGGAADVALRTGVYAEQSDWSNDTDSCAISHPIVKHRAEHVDLASGGALGRGRRKPPTLPFRAR